MNIGKTDGRLPGIQLGRAIAAIAVFYFHSRIALEAHGYFELERLHTWEWLAKRGAVGVDLFFAISGFIVCYVASRPSFTATDFLIKRVARIYPLNALTSLVMLALIFWRFCGGLHDLDDPVMIVGSFLILPQQSALNAVGWTLQYEMAFYLVSAALIPIGGPRLLLAWCLGATLIGTVFDFQAPLLTRFADGHWASFAAGIGSWMLACGSAPAPRWFVSLALITAGLAVYLLGLSLLFAWLTPVACCAVVLGLAWLPAAPRWTVKLGDISYGLYLWHWPVIMLSPWIAYWVRAGRGSGELWRWELLGLICFIASLSYMLFEKPINRWAAARPPTSPARRIGRITPRT